MAIPLRTIYQLNITLTEIEPTIWRRLLVSGSMRLDELHEALQIVMGWQDYHLHQFVMDKKYYGTLDDESPEDILNENDYKINHLLKKENDSLLYDYDFGDGWRHKITLEKILPYKKKMILPACIDGECACPPEDIGGIPGYYNFLEAIKNPHHEEHEDFLEWIGSEFDESAFDLEMTNNTLCEHC